MKMDWSIIITSVYTTKSSKTTRTEIIETALLKKKAYSEFFLSRCTPIFAQISQFLFTVRQRYIYRSTYLSIQSCREKTLYKDSIQGIIAPKVGSVPSLKSVPDGGRGYADMLENAMEIPSPRESVRLESSQRCSRRSLKLSGRWGACSNMM